MTKKREHRIATKTLKACCGTFFVVPNIVEQFRNIEDIFKEGLHPSKIQLFFAVAVVSRIKQPKLYAWLQMVRLPTIVAIKKKKKKWPEDTFRDLIAGLQTIMNEWTCLISKTCLSSNKITNK